MKETVAGIIGDCKSILEKIGKKLSNGIQPQDIKNILEIIKITEGIMHDAADLPKRFEEYQLRNL